MSSTGSYTGNDLRAALVIDKVRSILLDPRKARALGFCVSVAHAEYMAAKFQEAGIPAEALSAETPRADRNTAQDRLRRREVNFLFVVDLYNEGVDIPELDAVLFLRPTESLTVFLQQLGRGLRLDPEKECLTVLDFVGQAHRNFRFDLRYRALLTDPSVSLEQQVEHGFTHLPAGCTILMERVARQSVLENIRQNLRQTRSRLVDALRELAGTLGRPPRLSEFLERTEIEPDDLYRRGVCLVAAGRRRWPPRSVPRSGRATAHEGTAAGRPHQRRGADPPPPGPARTRIDATIGTRARPDGRSPAADARTRTVDAGRAAGFAG